MQPARKGDDFTGRMLGAINTMLLDMLAAVARKDYEDRRRRQAQGIEKAKSEGAYKGRQVDESLHQRVRELLADGKSIRKVAELIGCSTQTVQRVKRELAVQA
jgi:DNA invertase Pin-like site-specific DNA recombinase